VVIYDDVMAVETSGELLYLPHHRERLRLRRVENAATAEEASQETLNELFDQMVDLATMPTRHPNRLQVVAEREGKNSDLEVITYEICQRQNTGLTFLECVDSAILVRDDEDAIAVVEYLRTYYRGVWRQVRRPDELQFNWEPEYSEGSLGVTDAVLTETIADLHLAEIEVEINRRAMEQRFRYMLGAVAMTRSVR
jgi:hypothetical protein